MKIALFMFALSAFILSNCGVLPFTADNYDFANARYIALGTQVQDALDSIGISRWYKFTTSDIGIITISVTQVPSNIDMDVYVLDVNQHEVARSRQTPDGAVVTLQTVQPADTYWLKLEDGNHDRSSPGKYSVGVAVSNTPMVFSSTLHKAITQLGEADWYEVSTPKPGVLEFRIDSVPPNIDMEVHVYDHMMREIGNGGGNNGQSVFFMLLEDVGRYFFSLQDFEQNDYSQFPYALRVNFDTSDTFEINNDWSSAHAVPLSTDIRAKILPASDVDWFRFSVAQLCSIEVSVDSVPANINMQAHAFDHTQREVKSSGGNNGQSFAFSFPVAPGEYYLKLEDLDHNDYSDFFYRLRIEVSNAAPH